MPCYTVQVCNVELNNADLDLLKKALEKEGFTVQYNKITKHFSFQKRDITGRYDGKKLSMNAPKTTKIDSDAIKRRYSEEVIKRKAQQNAPKGWTMSKDTQTGEFVFKKQPQAVQQKMGW